MPPLPNLPGRDFPIRPPGMPAMMPHGTIGQQSTTSSTTLAMEAAPTVPNAATADPLVAVPPTSVQPQRLVTPHFHEWGLGTRCPYFATGPDTVRIDQLGIPTRFLNFVVLGNSRQSRPVQRAVPNAPIAVSDASSEHSPAPVSQAVHQPLTPVESSCTSVGPQQISDAEAYEEAAPKSPIMTIDIEGAINVGTVTLKPRA